MVNHTKYSLFYLGYEGLNIHWYIYLNIFIENLENML